MVTMPRPRASRPRLFPVMETNSEGDGNVSVTKLVN
jgi:hypothetical protein